LNSLTNKKIKIEFYYWHPFCIHGKEDLTDFQEKVMSVLSEAG